MNKVLVQKITVNSVVQVFHRKHYELAIGSDFINVFGVRANTGLTDEFDDVLGVMTRDVNDQWRLFHWAATTDPGKHYALNPMNKNGTGLLVPGQYKSSHRIGSHKGEYQALVQRGPMKVYRDRNKDDKYDSDATTIENGVFGINIHRASSLHSSPKVDRWSALCQVLQSPVDFRLLMDLATVHASIYDNVFNYTLLTETDFI